MPVIDTTSSDLQATAAASVVSVIVAMPSFFAAASGVLIRGDLNFDEAGLGLAVSIFFAASAATAAVGGRWAERLGASAALSLVAFTTAIVLLAIAVVAQDLIHLILLLALGGVSNGVAQPAASLALAHGSSKRQGLMFGVKQSSIPVASLIAGASIPVVGIAFGWRIAFVLGALLSVAVALLVMRNVELPPSGARAEERTREGDASMAPLVTLAIATGTATAAALTLPAFLVESAVEQGISLGSAGWMLVIASAASIVGRLGSGWWVDHHKGALFLATGMLMVGAVGHAMLAIGGPVLFAVGAIIAYAFGWGWSGLLMYAIVRLNPGAPGVATGIVLTGGSAGAAFGPFLFGLAVTRVGFDAAWLMAGGASGISACLLLGARSLLLTDKDRRAGAV